MSEFCIAYYGISHSHFSFKRNCHSNQKMKVNRKELFMLFFKTKELRDGTNETENFLRYLISHFSDFFVAHTHRRQKLTLVIMMTVVKHSSSLFPPTNSRLMRTKDLYIRNKTVNFKTVLL